MANKLKNIFSGTDKVAQTFTINAWHVSQSIDAFTGVQDYDINLSGSFAMTGSIYHTGIDNASGAAASVLVRNNSTGKYHITGSYAAGSGPAGAQGAAGAQGNAGSSGSSGSSG